LRILGASVEDWPDKITPGYCVFSVDLETTLRDEIGHELFDKLLSQAMAEFAIPKRKHAVKNPKVIAAIMDGARKEGSESESLNAIVGHVMSMVEPTTPTAVTETEPVLALTQ
jgi:hypothetical protein